MNKEYESENYDYVFKKYEYYFNKGCVHRWFRYLLSKIVENIDISKVNRALDVGCGEGSTVAYLSKQLENVKFTGIDFSDVAIKIAKKRHDKLQNLNFIIGDVKDIAPSSNTEGYDLVSCIEVLEHIDDWEKLLDTICHISKKYVLLAFPAGRMRDYEKEMGHLRNFKKGEIEEFMLSRGYKIVKTQYAGFPFYTPLARNWVNANTSTYTKSVSGKMSIPKLILNEIIYIAFRFFCFNNIGDKFTGLFERTE